VERYPPNGWGCKCKVFTLTKKEMQARGKDKPDAAPAIDMQPRTVGQTGPTPRTVATPKGVDPGWGYNVGEAAFGRPLATDAMAQWQAVKADAWERLTPGDWQSAGRPETIPIDAPKVVLGKKVNSPSDMVPLIEAAIGGQEKVFNIPGGVTVLVDAVALADHIDPVRSPYIPFLPELLNDPFEVWLSFEQHRGTGKVELRARIIKMIETGKDEGMLFVAQASRGYLLGWTFIPVRSAGYMQKQREGMLLFGRNEDLAV
jgi:hypothetical protein